ncbi:phage portal protein [Clostridium botulinum D/C]|uniref:phage portal protein n=1 Tax=Clostridium botulinum TaxID=1491 RepID=UPI001E5E4574|nr:phage portal protein [Clostridium botulinum]MCD3234318.1 phage portal protein [Clostridium botulinum D/C]MCD3240302.1 phage portal protein [Clostridium botulinum D/C]MCD3267737.1 phage portal protein [Clostridium botulinum D/C]MCD3306134.1 phage portal protein [Clostridium botulinum D/C]MCD3314918.1 phage portal protein [Clostridium botulinum D/C]
MLLQSLINNNQSNKSLSYAKILDGSYPAFSQFGQDIYVSDIVQMCIETIATEMSKLQPKHIYTNVLGIQQVPKSSINRLFKFAPNELMTTSEFIEKTTWLLFMNYNCFVLPIYDEIKDTHGRKSKYYKALYPLNPSRVDFLQDNSQKLFIKLYFPNGEKYTLLYSDIIHIRKKFSVNDIMGGGANGQPDNAALLKVLQINDTVLQGIGKAIQTSLNVRGILKINSLLEDEGQKAERKRLEKAIETGQGGIIPLDLKTDYVPIDIDPKVIDKDTLQFLQDKVLNWYGMSMPILSGKYNDEDYQAFYEKTLEPILIRSGQAYSKGLFSKRELDVGNEIVFYQKNMMYLSTNAKLNLLKTAGEQGLLTDDQKLAILGYPPLEDGSGSRRTISLNYIDTNVATQYQLKNASKLENGGNENV